MKTFPTLTSLKSGMQTNEIKFLDNDPTLPYVLGQDGQYHYFAKNTIDVLTPEESKNSKEPVFFVNPAYELILTSSRDLQEVQA